MGDSLEQALEGKTLEDIVHALPCSHPIQVEIGRLKEEVTRLRQCEDAITAAKDGVLVVWNLMDTNSTVIANDYWQSHLEEIDRLKAELEEANNTISRVEAANVHLQDQLASANKHKSDWHNMYQETYDELSSVQQAILVETARIKTAWREIATLERQLAEARAEIDHIKQVEFPKRIEKLRAEARQEAARTIERHLLGMFWCIPSKENEPMIYRDQAIEWLRGCFKLER